MLAHSGSRGYGTLYSQIIHWRRGAMVAARKMTQPVIVLIRQDRGYPGVEGAGDFACRLSIAY